VRDAQPVAPRGDVLKYRPSGGQECDHIEAVEAGLAGTGRAIPQGDVEPALRVDQPGAAQHAVLDKLGPQPQVEKPAVPAHAAGEVSDRQLDLRDPVQPGLADLEQLLSGVREAGLPVTLRVEGAPRPLPPTIDLSAYRIVQKALTNTLKHAGPACAEVTVRYDDGLVALEIADTGRGPDGVRGTGHGLVGMRERTAMLGGELEAAGAGGGGFTVRARLPVATPASA
jgi:signal transduction histidine kinase